MAEKVYTNPRVLKLGVKAGMRVLAIGLRGDAFLAEAREMGAEVVEVEGVEKASGAEAWDLVFLPLDHRDALGRIEVARPLLRRDGALWTLRPKGVKEITEAEVLGAGLAAGLVDVKVVSFSPVLTANKFVYRLRDR